MNPGIILYKKCKRLRNRLLYLTDKALRVGRPVRPLLPVDSIRQQTIDQTVKYFTLLLFI